MNVACIRSFAFTGVDAVPINVEARISPGFPGFLVTGLPEEASARGRIRAAFAGIGLSWPPGRVAVDLAPVVAPGDCGRFDLPIALAVLAAMDIVSLEEVSEHAAVGGLSPDGSVMAMAGVLAVAVGASNAGLGLICPASQGGEAAWAASGKPRVQLRLHVVKSGASPTEAAGSGPGSWDTPAQASASAAARNTELPPRIRKDVIATAAPRVYQAWDQNSVGEQKCVILIVFLLYQN